MKRCFWTFAGIFIFCGLLSAAPVSNAKAADITKLLEMTGSLKIADFMASAMLDQTVSLVRKTNQTIPDSVILIIHEEVKELLTEEMRTKTGFIGMMLPLYDKYFTPEEIKQLIAFYQTPIGQKTVRILPELTREGMMAGQKWGAAMEPIIEKRIKARLLAFGIKIKEL